MRSKKLWIFRFESYSIGCPRSTKSWKNNLPILSLKILVGLSPYYFLLESFPSIYCCKVYTYAGNNCPIKLYHVQASWPPVTEGESGSLGYPPSPHGEIGVKGGVSPVLFRIIPPSPKSLWFLWTHVHIGMNCVIWLKARV